MLSALIIIPLLAALMVALVPRTFRLGPRVIALTATLLTLLVALLLLLRFDGAAVVDGFRFHEKWNWISIAGLSLAYHVGLDGLNLGLVVMGTLVAFAAACVSWDIRQREKEFYLLLLVMTGGILGAFVSLDLFWFYFFHELALVPTFIMIGFWGRGEQKDYATFQITLYLSAGALLVLVGLILLYARSGASSLDWVELSRHLKAHPLSVADQRLIAGLLLLGFGVLVSLWPFHSWAPMGYASAPTATAMMHAGVLKKFGLYGLIRVALPLLPEGMAYWVPWLVVMAVGNMVYCGLVAMRQRDLNWLVGYSSVAHMGFAFLGIASLNVIGITGAVIIMVAHGLLAALTFALTGYLYRHTGTLEMASLGGLVRAVPFVGTCAMLALLAGCGLPGFANFVGEMMVFFGAWQTQSWPTVLAVWAGLVIAGVYMLRAIRRVFHGPLSARWAGVPDAVDAWRRLPFVLLLAVLMMLGCFPGWLAHRIEPAIQGLSLRPSGTVKVTPEPRSSPPETLAALPRRAAPTPDGTRTAPPNAEVSRLNTAP
jgi:NADH-quinone oxidoreductase subunit M